MQQVLRVVISSFTLIPYDFWGLLGEVIHRSLFTAVSPCHLIPFVLLPSLTRPEARLPEKILSGRDHMIHLYA